jgi:hypothetical protein
LTICEDLKRGHTDELERRLEAHGPALADEDTEDLGGKLVDHLHAPGAGGTIFEQGVGQSEV